MEESRTDKPVTVGIISSWCESGAGYVARAYRNILEKQGYHVRVYARGGRYCSATDIVWDQPNVTWGYWYQPPACIPYYLSTYVDKNHLTKWLENQNIDIVIANDDHSQHIAILCNALGYLVGNYIDVYKQSTVHNFSDFDFLLCNTQRHYSVFKKHPGSIYIQWGTDINTFVPNKCSIESSNDAATNITFFHSAGYGGRFNRKGTDLLLEAFQEVTGNARLVIHSIAPLSKYGKMAEEIVNSDPRIDFINKIVPAPGLYHLGDAFVYPTKLEGIGLCVPEALSCGLPVITTNNAPMNEFVTDGENGLLVDVKEFRTRKDNYYWPEAYVDVQHLTSQMQRYVYDRDLLLRHRMAARKSAVEHFDWEQNASGLGEQLENIVQRSRKIKRQPTRSQRIAWALEAAYVRGLTQVTRLRQAVKRFLQSAGMLARL